MSLMTRTRIFNAPNAACRRYACRYCGTPVVIFGVAKFTVICAENDGSIHALNCERFHDKPAFNTSEPDDKIERYPLSQLK